MQKKSSRQIAIVSLFLTFVFLNQSTAYSTNESFEDFCKNRKISQTINKSLEDYRDYKRLIKEIRQEDQEVDTWTALGMNVAGRATVAGVGGWLLSNWATDHTARAILNLNWHDSDSLVFDWTIGSLVRGMALQEAIPRASTVGAAVGATLLPLVLDGVLKIYTMCPSRESSLEFALLLCELTGLKGLWTKWTNKNDPPIENAKKKN